MIIQILSDTHIEGMSDRQLDSFFKTLSQTPNLSQVEVLVLAGDVYSSNSYGSLKMILERFSSMYPNVVKCAGNHFYYGDNVGRREEWRRHLNIDIPNLHFLENETITINNQRFIIGTGWFPRLSNQTKEDREGLNDFYQIEGSVPWIYNQNKAFNGLLQKELCSSDILVTHHLVSWMSVAPQFKNSRLNQFFVNDNQKLILQRQPKLAIHGHTHTPTSYLLGNTKVIANPRGYPNSHETINFNPFLTIEV